MILYHFADNISNGLGIQGQPNDQINNQDLLDATKTMNIVLKHFSVRQTQNLD